jgi:hypothetical protein
MACNDYERIPRDFQVTERIRSHYQSIMVFYGEQEDDACLYLDNYLHTVSSHFLDNIGVDMYSSCSFPSFHDSVPVLGLITMKCLCTILLDLLIRSNGFCILVAATQWCCMRYSNIQRWNSLSDLS